MTKPLNRILPPRVCECCERASTPRIRKPGEPQLVTIQIVLSYKGAGKTIQKAAPSIRICVDCLALALSEPKLWERKQSRRLLAAIRERVSHSYNSALETEAMNQAVRPRFDVSGNLLESL